MVAAMCGGRNSAWLCGRSVLGSIAKPCHRASAEAFHTRRGLLPSALRANAVYEGSYLLGTSIARPLIAARQIDVARRTGADAVAHGATGKGNDQVRFELAYYSLEPDIRVIAPWRDPKWTLTSRSLMIEFAARHGIAVPVTAEKPYSMDRNLLHVSYEGGILE